MPLDIFQGSIRELVFGASTNMVFLGPVAGLGIPVPRANDLDRAGDGAVGGFDRLPRRVLYFPIGFEGSTPEASYELFQEFKSAWRPSPIDIPLELRLPGMPSSGLRWFGRPRGFEPDLTHLKSGHLAALCTFEALDPIGYGDLVEEGPSAGPLTVENLGDAPVDAVVTIVGDGGTPVLSNADDNGDAISFGTTLGVGQVRILDTRARTVVDDLGEDWYDELESSGQWFRIASGENELTLTGAATVAVEFRSGFY